MFKKNIEVIPEAEFPVWNCSNENCNGWMRTDYTFEEQPICPLCHSQMVNEIKTLPVLQNYVK
ncbi:cold-shock protein [Ferviditalea candida]|uniref:Cold-shock protein n=1 Tax=Ferviditalea candida TaxID=3108399 RepID=A0ABU5ZI17_9BACL|nr:cold-shock protein [Paenibacillaceae bacterium T2]